MRLNLGISALVFCSLSYGSSALAVDLGQEVCKKTYDSYKDRLAKNPEDDQAWSELRVCTNELKRWNEAAQISSDALQKNPNLPQAHLLLGITELHSKDYKNAAADFQKATELNPNLPAPYYYLGMADLFMSQASPAAEAAQKAVSLDPKNPTYYSQLAYADFLLQDNDEAELAAKKAIALDPNNVAAYKVLGNIYKSEGREDESDKAFEDAIHANGRQVTAAAVPAAPASGATPVSALPGMSAPAAVAVLPSAAAPAAAAATPKTSVPAVSAPPPEPEPVDAATQCKRQWERMRTAVAANDYQRALTYFSDYADTREQYRQSFERLGPRLQSMIANIGDPDDCQVVLLVATCKATVTGAAGTILETTIHFERNDDKVWRIKSF